MVHILVLAGYVCVPAMLPPRDTHTYNRRIDTPTRPQPRRRPPRRERLRGLYSCKDSSSKPPYLCICVCGMCEGESEIDDGVGMQYVIHLKAHTDPAGHKHTYIHILTLTPRVATSRRLGTALSTSSSHSAAADTGEDWGWGSGGGVVQCRGGAAGAGARRGCCCRLLAAKEGEEEEEDPSPCCVCRRWWLCGRQEGCVYI